MADHVMWQGAGRVVRILVGVAVGVVTATVSVVAAILSFDLNPVGPVFVALASIAGGSLLARRTHDAVLKGAAIGFIVGGVAAVLLWPLFAVDTGGDIETG